MTTAAPTAPAADLIRFVDSLSVEAIEEALAAVDGQSDALRTLLRAARARRRGERTRHAHAGAETPPGGG
jgi:hypothetical protein